MFERILNRLRECVRMKNYIVTLHADEEIAEEGLSILDVEKAMIEGHITERQKDADTGEWKYLVTGPIGEVEVITVVTKLSPTGRMVLITVFNNED